MGTKLLLEKSRTRLSLADLNLHESDEHWIEVWSDPSKKLILDILSMVMISAQELAALTKQEQDELYNDYLRAVEGIFLDSNIEGLDFSSQEAIRESLSSEHLPWNFFYDLTVAYTSWTLLFHDKIKKVLRLQNVTSNSGESKKEKESE
jgi:hypothetical protein